MSGLFGKTRKSTPAKEKRSGSTGKLALTTEPIPTTVSTSIGSEPDSSHTRKRQQAKLPLVRETSDSIGSRFTVLNASVSANAKNKTKKRANADVDLTGDSPNSSSNTQDAHFPPTTSVSSSHSQRNFGKNRTTNQSADIWDEVAFVQGPTHADNGNGSTSRTVPGAESVHFSREISNIEGFEIRSFGDHQYISQSPEDDGECRVVEQPPPSPKHDHSPKKFALKDKAEKSHQKAAHSKMSVSSLTNSVPDSEGEAQPPLQQHQKRKRAIDPSFDEEDELELTVNVSLSPLDQLSQPPISATQLIGMDLNKMDTPSTISDTSPQPDASSGLLVDGQAAPLLSVETNAPRGVETQQQSKSRQKLMDNDEDYNTYFSPPRNEESDDTEDELSIDRKEEKKEKQKRESEVMGLSGETSVQEAVAGDEDSTQVPLEDMDLDVYHPPELQKPPTPPRRQHRRSPLPSISLPPENTEQVKLVLESPNRCSNPLRDPKTNEPILCLPSQTQQETVKAPVRTSRDSNLSPPLSFSSSQTASEEDIFEPPATTTTESRKLPVPHANQISKEGEQMISIEIDADEGVDVDERLKDVSREGSPMRESPPPPPKLKPPLPIELDQIFSDSVQVVQEKKGKKRKGRQDDDYNPDNEPPESPSRNEAKKSRGGGAALVKRLYNRKQIFLHHDKGKGASASNPVEVLDSQDVSAMSDSDHHSLPLLNGHEKSLKIPQMYVTIGGVQMEGTVTVTPTRIQLMVGQGKDHPCYYITWDKLVDFKIVVGNPVPTKEPYILMLAFDDPLTPYAKLCPKYRPLSSGPDCNYATSYILIHLAAAKAALKPKTGGPRPMSKTEFEQDFWGNLTSTAPSLRGTKDRVARAELQAQIWKLSSQQRAITEFITSAKPATAVASDHQPEHEHEHDSQSPAGTSDLDLNSQAGFEPPPNEERPRRAKTRSSARKKSPTPPLSAAAASASDDNTPPAPPFLPPFLPPEISAIPAEQDLLVYDRINLRVTDVMRLRKEEFLNDNIIDFWIAYLGRNLPREQMDRCHMFNSHFFSSLNRTGGVETSAKRWDKNVDLFSKDFLFVPINYSNHWTLAIVCYPSRLNPRNPPPPQISSPTSDEHNKAVLFEDTTITAAADGYEVSTDSPALPLAGAIIDQQNPLDRDERLTGKQEEEPEHRQKAVGRRLSKIRKGADGTKLLMPTVSPSAFYGGQGPSPIPSFAKPAEVAVTSPSDDQLNTAIIHESPAQTVHLELHENNSEETQPMDQCSQVLFTDSVVPNVFRRGESLFKTECPSTSSTPVAKSPGPTSLPPFSSPTTKEIEAEADLSVTEVQPPAEAMAPPLPTDLTSPEKDQPMGEHENVFESNQQAEGEAEEGGEQGTTTTPKRANKVKPLVEPLILYMDSLGGSKSDVSRKLREFLARRWNHFKRKPEEAEVSFDKHDIKWEKAVVPQQNNFCDCGVFVLHYIELFAQRPWEIFKDHSDWFTIDVIEKKREDIRDIIIGLHQAQKGSGGPPI